MSDDFKEIAPRNDDVSAQAPEKAESAEKNKKVFDSNSTSGLVVLLFVITAAVALLLGAVNSVTEDRIDENARQAAARSMEVVIEADRYEQIPETKVYLAYKNDELVGYASQTAPAGYGGAIDIMVGVNLLGQVTGVDIIKHNETPGLGSKAKTEPWFLEQFSGKGASVALGSGVDAISGSTITSGAVAKGVQEAVQNALRYGNTAGGAK